jgi:hypothetical protein
MIDIKTQETEFRFVNRLETIQFDENYSIYKITRQELLGDKLLEEAVEQGIETNEWIQEAMQSRKKIPSYPRHRILTPLLKEYLGLFGFHNLSKSHFNYRLSEIGSYIEVSEFSRKSFENTEVTFDKIVKNIDLIKDIVYFDTTDQLVYNSYFGKYVNVAISTHILDIDSFYYHDFSKVLEKLLNDNRLTFTENNNSDSINGFVRLTDKEYDSFIQKTISLKKERKLECANSLYSEVIKELDILGIAEYAKEESDEYF